MTIKPTSNAINTAFDPEVRQEHTLLVGEARIDTAVDLGEQDVRRLGRQPDLGTRLLLSPMQLLHAIGSGDVLHRNPQYAVVAAHRAHTAAPQRTFHPITGDPGPRLQQDLPYRPAFVRLATPYNGLRGRNRSIIWRRADDRGHRG